MKKQPKVKEPRTVYQSIGDIRQGLVIILEDMKKKEMDVALDKVRNRRFAQPHHKHYMEARRKVEEEVERKYKVLKNLKE